MPDDTPTRTARKKFVRIRYGTSAVPYEAVRKGIFQNKDRLTGMGYECSWTGDLDLNMQLKPAEIRGRGYYVTRGAASARFKKKLTMPGFPALLFEVTINLASKTAVISGQSNAPISGLDNVAQDFENLTKATGIQFTVRNTSDVY